MKDKIYIIRDWGGFWICRTAFVNQRINCRPYPNEEIAIRDAKEMAKAYGMRQSRFAVVDKR